MKKIANYINGAMLEPQSGEYFDNINPAKGEPYTLIPDSDESDVGMAVEAAQKAFPSWSGLSLEERSSWRRFGRRRMS